MSDKFILRSAAIDFIRKQTAALVDPCPKRVMNDTFDCIIRFLAQLPAADVEEVVHCIDCAGCSPVMHWRTGELTYYLCNRTDFVVQADGFCNFGRRRTNNERE